MRGIVSSPELIHWSPNPQYLRMRLYLGIGPLKKKVQMRPLGWALIQSDWSYMKRKFLYTGERPGIHTHTHTQENSGEDTARGQPSASQGQRPK